MEEEKTPRPHEPPMSRDQVRIFLTSKFGEEMDVAHLSDGELRKLRDLIAHGKDRKIYEEWLRVIPDQKRAYFNLAIMHEYAHRELAMQTEAKVAPPKGFLVDALLPPADAEERLYNILGRYNYWLRKYGPFRAHTIFYLQSVGTVIGFWIAWLSKHLKVLEYLRKS